MSERVRKEKVVAPVVEPPDYSDDPVKALAYEFLLLAGARVGKGERILSIKERAKEVLAS